MVIVLIVSAVSAFPGAEEYLAGCDAERAGHYGDAVRAYAECADAGGPLASYAHLRMAGCQAPAPDPAASIAAYERFITDEAPGPWTSMARALLALRQLEKQDFAATASLLDTLVTTTPRLWWFDRYTKAAAECWLELPERREAGYAFFRDTVRTTVLWKPRLEAAKVLAESAILEDRLLAAFGMLRSGASKDAGILLLKTATEMLSAEAVTLNDAILDEWALSPARGDSNPSWWSTLAKHESGTMLERVWLASIVRRSIAGGKLDTARRACDVLAERHASADETAEAFWWLAKHFERQDEPQAAIESYVRLVQCCAGHFRADDALITAARLYKTLGDNAGATQALLRLPKEYPDSQYVAAAWYLLGALSESASDTKAAVEHYGEAAKQNLGDYYVHRAWERLFALGAGDQADAVNLRIDSAQTFLRACAPPDTVPEVSQELLQDARFQRLYFFGEHGLEEGEWEALSIGLSLKEAQDPSAAFQTMAEAGFAHTAFQFVEAFGWGMEGKCPSQARLRVMFPRAYWSHVMTLGKDTGVDPYLILAVARQESRFRPALTSAAGAQGVMQVMPGTATWVAKVEPNVDAASAKNLEHPATSLRLGTYYLMRMIERCDGNLVYALASYNAGPGNLNKWRKNRSDADLESFVEAIPFAETRQYVKAVLGNYAAYHSLYPPVSATPDPQ